MYYDWFSSFIIQIISLGSQVFTIGGYISRTQDSPAHWGLSALLQVVNTEFLSQFGYLLSSMNSDVSTEDSEDYLVSLNHVNLLLGLDERWAAGVSKVF